MRRKDAEGGGGDRHCGCGSFVAAMICYVGKLPALLLSRTRFTRKKKLSWVELGCLHSVRLNYLSVVNRTLCRALLLFFLNKKAVFYHDGAINCSFLCNRLQCYERKTSAWQLMELNGNQVINF